MRRRSRSFRCLHLLVAALAALLALSASVNAQQRVALVIGNGAYQYSPVLPNPRNDARDIALALDRLGFSVARIEDANFDTMRRALRDFSQRARNADMAVVFFAGHGMEVGGENWLIPVDAELKADTDADHEAITLKSVLGTVETARNLGLVVLDACRNNPFTARMLRTVRTRSVDRGFARIEPEGNVLVAYSAKDGTVASDGNGRNSPFTAALLKHIEEPNVEINILFRRVRDDVMAATRRTQQPFVYGSLSQEEIFLKGRRPSGTPSVAAPAPPAVTPPKQDQVAALSPVTTPIGAATLLGQFGDWGAYVATPNGQKSCFALVKSQQSRGGRSPNVYLFITTWPARQIKNEVSIMVSGYTFKPSVDATFEAGGATFALYTQNDGAWIKNLTEAQQMFDSLNRGSTAVLKGTTSGGAQTTGTFSLKGIAQAVDRMGQECR